MKPKKLSIVICSGGTGGHLFPSKSITDSLLKINSLKEIDSKNDCYLSVEFFTDKRSLAFLNSLNKDVAIKNLYTLQFSGKSIILKLKSLFFMGIGFLQSMYYFITNRPKVVVAFGGYVTVPVLFAAVILRIPIILHEQNAVLGRANSLFAKYAKIIATTFEKTLGLNKYLDKVKLTGLPIRKELTEFVNVNNFNNDDSFTLSILGGSQGSNILGKFIPKAFALLPLEIQQKLIVYHQCRLELLSGVCEEWKKVNAKVEVKPFFNNIASVLYKSDLIISRAGASTIAEINYFGKPALYIPFKQAILNHQEVNALSMVNQGAAEVILEDALNFNTFNDIIINLLVNKNKRYIMSLSAKKASKLEAVDILTSLIINLAINKNAKL